MPISQDFQNRFRELVAERGGNKTQIAAEMNITYVLFSKAYNYGILPRPAVLVRIADHFGVSMDFLLGKTEENNFVPARERVSFAQRLEQLRQAYEAAQQAWLQALQAAAAQMGYEIDITNPVMVAAAESLILPKLEQQETLQAQLDQLKQLNTAQKGLDAGIAAMMDKGTVSTEEETLER